MPKPRVSAERLAAMKPQPVKSEGGGVEVTFKRKDGRIVKFTIGRKKGAQA